LAQPPDPTQDFLSTYQNFSILDKNSKKMLFKDGKLTVKGKAHVDFVKDNYVNKPNPKVKIAGVPVT